MYTVTWTAAKKKAAIKILTKWFSEHGIGECIMQSDEALITAPEILAEIADKILVEREGITWDEIH
jgi:hypothetical protein